MMNYEIRKIGDRFYCDFMSHEMVWDDSGNYLGQFQEDMLGDAGLLFFKANGYESFELSLTEEQKRILSY